MRRRVLLIAVCGLLCGMAFCWPLWYSAHRVFLPVVPLSDTLQWLGPLDFLAFLLPACGAFAVLQHSRKSPVFLLLFLLALLSLADINRFQPWVYTWALVLLVVALAKADSAAQQAIRWVVAGIYLWGGLMKCSPYFAEDTFTWFCEAFSWSAPLGKWPVWGYAVALLEAVLGPALLWTRTRHYARWAAYGFHTWIVLSLSPLGHHWNTVVIPWNLGMAALVWAVFSDKQATQLPEKWLWAPVALAFFLPALHLVGAWPESLSWKMYSNTQPEATFYTEGGAPCPSMADIWQTQAFDAGSKLTLDDWGQAEAGVPLLSENRVFFQLGRYLCNCATHPDSSGLIVLRVKPWQRGAETIKKIPCRDILSPSR